MKNAQDALDGFTIVAAALVGLDRVVFGAHENVEDTGMGNEPYKQRLLGLRFETRGWGWKQYDHGFEWPHVAGGHNVNGNPQALFINASGNVLSFEYDDGPNALEDQMPARGMRRVRFIGEHFYAAGLGRSFMRRKGPGDWEVFSHTPFTDRESDPGPYGAFDGYAEDDIYIAHGERYVSDGTPNLPGIHHWNGTDFTPIPLPPELLSNVPWAPFSANAIVCAPDGRVFVSGSDAELIVGNREAGFITAIPQYESNIGNISNLVWFKGELYGATDGALWRFNGTDAWEHAPFLEDENRPVAFPYLDANDDIMLLAGGFGAAIYDGESWTRIAGDVSALDITRLQLMERQVDDIRELRDILRDEVERR